MNEPLLKQAKKGLLMAKKKEETKAPIYFTTNHTLMDLVVGGGEAIGYGMGYPAGSVVRDHAGEGSSKSFKAVECIAANAYKYKDKFKWCYADIERGNTIDTQTLYGLQIIDDEHAPPKDVLTVEALECDVNRFLDSLKDDECGIYVVDSLDSLSSQEIEERKEKRRAAFEKGKDFDEGSYLGGSAKFLSQEFFRGLTAKLERKNALLYIISQERDNMNAGMYGKKYRVGGGRAVGFYESVRVQSKLIEKEERKGRAVRALISVTAEKTRHPRPYRDCYVSLVFTYGMDSLYDELCFLYDCRSDKTGELLKRSESLKWDDQPEMGLEALVEYIGVNKLRGEVKKRVIEKWEAIEASIAIHRPPKFEDA
jgi:hypothetical protein